MAKTVEEKLKTATAKLEEAKGGDTASAEGGVKVRKAKKIVKRLQRKQGTAKAVEALKGKMEEGHQKNIDKVKERETKKKQAQEAVVAKAAEVKAKAEEAAKAKAEEAAKKAAEEKAKADAEAQSKPDESAATETPAK